MAIKLKTINLKKGCGIGCLILFSATVVLMGAATWYARKINHEYKIVQRTEQALLAATGDAPFIAPAGLTLTPGRLDAFLAVRDSLQGNREGLEAAALEFAREKDRSERGGFKAFLSLLDSGSELAPVYATYWSLRNRALLAHEMSPAEYIWLYNAVYYKWLGRDPADGRDLQTSTLPILVEIPGEFPPVTQDLLVAHHRRLEATYSPQLNPVELIFAENSPPAK